MTRRALITGITGQDGSYLAELLLEKGYEVYGFVRRVSNDPFVRLEHIKNRIHILLGNVTDLGAVRVAVEQAQPDEVYSLAAQTHVGNSFQCEAETFETNYYGVLKIVDETLRVNPNAKIYQASTSEMFGNALPPQNERTPFDPQSPYAESKVFAHERAVVQCRAKGAFICSGFLFNHESPRRGKQFVSRKVTHSFAKIVFGLQDYIELGNIDSRRDWGYAPDYVEAMWMMLQQKEPEDYVIATGQARTVREFVNVVARELNIRLVWHGTGVDETASDQFGNTIVRINPKFFRPREVHYLQGDSSKARTVFGWEPRTSFDDAVRSMLYHDLSIVSQKTGISASIRNRYNDSYQSQKASHALQKP